MNETPELLITVKIPANLSPDMSLRFMIQSAIESARFGEMEDKRIQEILLQEATLLVLK